MRKNVVRIVAVLLAVILAGSVIVGALANVVHAVSQSEIDELKEQRKQIEQQSQEISAEIDSLEYEQMTVIAQKQVLDEQVTITQNLIDTFQSRSRFTTVLLLIRNRK